MKANKLIMLFGVLVALTSCSSTTSSVKLSSSGTDNKVSTYTNPTKTSLYFGSYPQSKVSDSSLISTLNTTAGTLPTSEDTYKWTDYGYYEKGSIKSYMYYIDIDQDNDGLNDYRGVYFTTYRHSTTLGSNSGTSSHYQSSNGYSTNTVYWFKYESIKWNILTTSNDKALVLSDLILDSQDYYYDYKDRSGDTDYQGNTTSSTVYANNYMYSHIRSWLNTTFYETAFSKDEQNKILTTNVDNSASSTSSSSNSYACANTNDKMFLLSYKEATTYCSSTSRQAQGSDYAKSQGLNVYSSNTFNWKGKSDYWLRSPDGYDHSVADQIALNGDISFTCDVYETSYGVRMACWINL